MRIVSQNRHISVDFDKVIIEIFNKNLVYAVSYSDHKILAFLGEYFTEERAQEVFQDIHSAYSPVGLITCELSEEQAMQFIGLENVKQNVVMMPPENKDWVVNTYDSIVYYMPEK